MDMKLELVVVPVSDVDRAKAFYERAGFRLDVDHDAGEAFRVVQLTPPGSACSIAIGRGITQVPPGTYQGLHLVVGDIEAARDDLLSAACRSARSSTSGLRVRSRVLTPSAAPTARSRPSAIRTATAGYCKRSGS